MFLWYYKHRNDIRMVGFCIVLAILVHGRKIIFASLTHVILVFKNVAPNFCASYHTPLLATQFILLKDAVKRSQFFEVFYSPPWFTNSTWQIFTDRNSSFFSVFSTAKKILYKCQSTCLTSTKHKLNMSIEKFKSKLKKSFILSTSSISFDLRIRRLNQRKT